MNNNLKYMQIAIKEAKKAAKRGDVPVGAVIVYKNKIIAKAHNKKQLRKNSLKHAELLVINKACKKLKTWHLDECTIYVTLEPCMMCMGAILYEEFSKVVYAATLQDSNDNYCPEMITNIDELAKYSKDKIEIIKELHREQAVEVLKTRGE